MNEVVQKIITEKINEKIALEKANVERERALRAGVCPDCAGDVIEINKIWAILTQKITYKCTDCECKHYVFMKGD